MNIPRSVVDAILGMAGLLILLALWQTVAASGLVSRAFLPTPAAAFKSLFSGLQDGSLALGFAETALRLVEGWLAASLLGVMFGTVIGLSRPLRELLQPTLEFLRPLPAPAIIPLAIALLGLGPAMVLLVIVFGSIWPPMLSTIQGLNLVEPRLNEVTRMLGLSRTAFVVKIGIPSALPDVFSGLRVSVSIALILSVLGEMLAGQPGLGQTILLSARSFRSYDMFAGLILLAVLGIAANLVLRWLERRLIGWQQPAR
jgi:ABC-type nitrate/sulfonate/bicarbonate transport system permease component